jgi:hypothetical protein
MERNPTKSSYNLRNIEPMSSSSLPILPPYVQTNFPKLPDSQQVSIERELTSGPTKPLYSPVMNYPADLHESPLSLHQRTINMNVSPFVSQAMNVGISAGNSGVIQGVSSNLPWVHMNQVQGLMDYSVAETIVTGRTNISGDATVATDDLTKQNEWWSDIINDDWKDILDATATESQPRVQVFITYYGFQ